MLKLPNKLSLVHMMLYVSMLKMCISDPVSILPLEGSRVDEHISYGEIPIEFLDQQVQRLRNKEVASVNVL